MPKNCYNKTNFIYKKDVLRESHQYKRYFQKPGSIPEFAKFRQRAGKSNRADTIVHEENASHNTKAIVSQGQN